MTKELVPVAGLDPSLRRMFAFHDLHVLEGAVTRQAEVDDYATEQMQAAMAESAQEALVHPLHERLEKLEEQVNAPVPSGQPHTRRRVAQKIAPKPILGSTPAPDPRKIAKDVARRYHPDFQPENRDTGSLARITEALDVSVADFFQTTALELTRTATPDTEASDLELQRYQVWLGLQYGQRSKFTHKAEVDVAIAKERQWLAAGQPLGIAQRSFNLAVQLLGVRGDTGMITRLGGPEAKWTAQQFQEAAEYLSNPSLEKHVGADTDPELQKQLTLLIDDLTKACMVFTATPETKRAYLGQHYGWNAMLAYIGRDFQAIVDRLRRIAEPVIELDSPDFFRNAILRAARERRGQGDSIMYGTKPTSGYYNTPKPTSDYIHYNPQTKRPYNNEPYEEPYM